MYAAQFDLVDTAKILLAAGAEVDAVTSQDGNDVQLDSSKRTALMYAAENASADMIRLLLARGADAAAADSNHRGLLYYLDLNQRLAAEDHTILAAALTKAGAKP
jgi:ankyrin repeat protein